MGAVSSIFKFSLQECLVQSYPVRLVGNTFLNFVSNLSFRRCSWVLCAGHQMGFFNVKICSIFVPFLFPCYDIGSNLASIDIICICSLLQLICISEVVKISASKPFIWILVQLGGREVHVWARFVIKV